MTLPTGNQNQKHNKKATALSQAPADSPEMKKEANHKEAQQPTLGAEAH